MQSRKYSLVLLLIASVIEIQANACNSVGENICEVHHYDPDQPITSDVPADSIVEVRLNATSKSMKLTSNVCNAFPNLLKIKAMEIGLKEVAADAFQNCSKLTAVYLPNNQISSLDSEIFKKNTELERIELFNNTLKTFDTTILNHTPKMHLVFLSDNGMEEFTLDDTSTELKELWKIELQNNKLKSLDLHEVAKKFPNLRVLVMCKRDVGHLENMDAPDASKRTFLSLNDFDSCE